MDLAHLRRVLRPEIIRLSALNTHTKLPELCETLGLPAPDQGISKREKLTEALFDVTETARECEPGLLEVIDDNAHVTLSDSDLRQLEAKARAGDDAGIRLMVFSLLASIRTAGEGKVTRLSRPS